jgi:hypothetical protein
MRKYAPLFAASALLATSLACTITPRIPEINISVPTIEVGEIREIRESVPLPQSDTCDVDVVFGAGKLEMEAGVSDKLLDGVFRYNVAHWAPEVTCEGDDLTIKQGGDQQKWGVPSGNVRNQWELEFSPEIPLAINVKAGAGDGRLDMTDLRVSDLDVDLGAGNFVLRFDEPSPLAADRLTVDSGAAKVETVKLGNASPKEVRLQGGVGDISVDLTGAWSRSADVTIRAGAGTLRLTLPSDVGVKVETRGGLTNVEAYGLRQMGGTYTNDAYGVSDVELNVSILTGVGNVRLIEEGVRE